VIETGLGPEAGHSDNSSDFRKVFVGRVHEVLEQGYLRLTPLRTSVRKNQQLLVISRRP